MSKVLYMFKKIMNPNHERWDEFVTEMLKRFEFCDHTHRTTRAILQEMQGIDVDGTLEVFESLGGCCDGEVILNVVSVLWIRPTTDSREGEEMSSKRYTPEQILGKLWQA